MNVYWEQMILKNIDSSRGYIVDFKNWVYINAACSLHNFIYLNWFNKFQNKTVFVLSSDWNFLTYKKYFCRTQFLI